MDTNIWVTYLTQRNEKEGRSINKLFGLIKLGKIIPYCSNIVFLEIFFVMVSLYKFEKSTVAEDIRKFLNLRNLVIVEKTNTRLAFEYLQKYGVKLADAFIATQVPKKVVMVTSDKEFKKLKFLETAVPDEIIGMF